MAKKNRPSVQKREREQKKRDRERKKAEKAAIRRERRGEESTAAAISRGSEPPFTGVNLT